MNTLKRKSAIAAVLIAVGATTFGAQAADTLQSNNNLDNQAYVNSVRGYTPVEQRATVATNSSARQSRQLFAFEKEVEQLDAPSLTTADRHNFAQRKNSLPSPFDSYDLASPGG